MVKTTLTMHRFKSFCFVGLNKAELVQGKQSDTAEHWWDLIDDSLRHQRTMLAFISPKDGNGKSLPPLAVLGDEKMPVDEAGRLDALAKKLAMFDFGRAVTASANRINILAVADILCYWDHTGTFVQPTTPETWLNDLKALANHYPRTTEKHLYTHWDKTNVPEGIISHSLLDLPLEDKLWSNQPSFQESYGAALLVAGLVAAVVGYGANLFQNSTIKELRAEQRQMVEKAGQLASLQELAPHMDEPTTALQQRGLMATIVKDLGAASYAAEFKFDRLETQLLTPERGAPVVLATYTAPTTQYPDFLSQEPLAKQLLDASATLAGLRKQSGGKLNEFKLEGLVLLPELQRQLRQPATPEGTP